MNMNQPSNEFRILAVSLSSRGFGYAVMEGGNKLILYGKKIFNYEKNARSLAQIEKVIAHNQPDVLVLQDVNAKSMLKIPAKTCHSTWLEAIGQVPTLAPSVLKLLILQLFPAGKDWPQCVSIIGNPPLFWD